MIDGIVLISLVCLFGGIGTWLLLPLKHGSWSRRWGDRASLLYSRLACAAAGVAVAAPLVTAIGRPMSSGGRVGLAIGLSLALAAVGFALGSMRSVRNTPYGFICGVLLATIGLAFFASTWNAPGLLIQNAFFYLFAILTLVGGLLTITSRNPVHSALWFAMVVLSTSGLFLLAGAQFLAAGTIIVYAGAIIVTFLFVIMLAQSEGQAIYDRKARAPGAAAIAGFGLAWAVFYAIVTVGTSDGPAKIDPSTILVPADRLVYRATRDADTPNGPVRYLSRREAEQLRSEGKGFHGQVFADDAPAIVQGRAIRPTALLDGPDPSQPRPHVAGIGATLFTDHLLAVEIGGALLFIALVGAISMATPRAPIRPADRSGIAAGDVAQARNLAESAV